MTQYEVWYVNPKSGKHVLRKTHDSFMSALRHSINLANYERSDGDFGLFSYVRDTETGLVAAGEYDKIKWISLEEAFPEGINK